MASKIEQIMAMKKELDFLKGVIELLKENDALKNETEDVRNDLGWFINHRLIEGSEIETEWHERNGMIEEEEEEEEEEEFNEICEECGVKMSSKKLTEEEFDEYPDRDEGYCTYTGNWFCIKCRVNTLKMNKD